MLHMKKLLLILTMVVGTVYATCSSPISRTNFSANSILTSTALNTQFNDVFNKVNDLDGDCLTAGTVDKDRLNTGAIANSTVTSKSADYTVTVSDQINLANASSGNVTYTLPTAVGNTGQILTFKRIDAATNTNVIIDGNASQTIDGSTTKTLFSQYDYLKIMSDGSNWVIIDNGIKNRYQTQYLSADVTSAGDVADLQFDNLVVGRTYRIGGKVWAQSFSNNVNGLQYYSGTGGTGTLYNQTINVNAAGTNSNITFNPNTIFTAVSTTLYVYKTGTQSVYGDGTTTETFLTLEDITEQYAETTELD